MPIQVDCCPPDIQKGTVGPPGSIQECATTFLVSSSARINTNGHTHITSLNAHSEPRVFLIHALPGPNCCLSFSIDCKPYLTRLQAPPSPPPPRSTHPTLKEGCYDLLYAPPLPPPPPCSPALVSHLPGMSGTGGSVSSLHSGLTAPAY